VQPLLQRKTTSSTYCVCVWVRVPVCVCVWVCVWVCVCEWVWVCVSVCECVCVWVWVWVCVWVWVSVSVCECECVCVCVCGGPSYPAWHAHAPFCHLFPAPLYNIFHIISLRAQFSRKEIIKCVFQFLCSFVWNISHYKKNWVRYDHKCKVVFI
jgi:hypothetical protein